MLFKKYPTHEASPARLFLIGNESLPKTIVNDTSVFLKCNQHFGNFKPITIVSECCLIKLYPHILFEKYSNILALEMASPGNRHCADCIGALSFPVGSS